MNYYHCYGFSDINETQQEVDILIAHTDINAARMFANRYINNISHFDIYPLDYKEFGCPVFTVMHEGEKIQIISSSLTIKDAFKILSDVGMDIISIDSIMHPLKENLQRIIAGMLRKEFGLSSDDPFTSTIETDDSINGALTPAQVIKITEFITHILQDAKELYVKTKGIIGGDNFIMFTRNIEQLQQSLGQGNIDIAKEQTKKLITAMEQIEGEYIDYEKARDHEVQNKLTIPNLNTILAHNQRLTANKVYELQSAENNKVEQWYMTIYHMLFEKIVLYITGIINEIGLATGGHNSAFHYIIKKTEYTLIFLSGMIMTVIEGGGNIYYRGNVLYVIGIIGCMVQCSHIIQTKHRYIKVGLMLGGGSVIGYIGYILASNLALI